MKCVTALRGVTWQHNFIIGVCPNTELKYRKSCYLTAVISYSLKINNPPPDRLKNIWLKFKPLVKFTDFISNLWKNNVKYSMITDTNLPDGIVPPVTSLCLWHLAHNKMRFVKENEEVLIPLSTLFFPPFYSDKLVF